MPVLRKRRAFENQGTAQDGGKKAQLWVAQTSVVLDRPARKRTGGQQTQQPGPPIELRLIIVQLRNGAGKVLAQWLLLSNVPTDWADAAPLGRCYDWRWQIESDFQLLKSHGQPWESWPQQTAPAIARRLRVASMACVIVWGLLADESAAALEFKTLLVRLSGRQTKRSRPHTAPALLAGLWTLLSMLSWLHEIDRPARKTQLETLLPQNQHQLINTVR